jgi:hypothetical protein
MRRRGIWTSLPSRTRVNRLLRCRIHRRAHNYRCACRTPSSSIRFQSSSVAGRTSSPTLLDPLLSPASVGFAMDARADMPDAGDANGHEGRPRRGRIHSYRPKSPTKGRAPRRECTTWPSALRAKELVLACWGRPRQGHTAASQGIPSRGRWRET